jgi:hypothetical protein
MHEVWGMEFIQQLLEVPDHNSVGKAKIPTFARLGSGLLMSETEPEMRLFRELHLRVVNSPLRRKILDVLSEGDAIVEEWRQKLG